MEIKPTSMHVYINGVAFLIDNEGVLHLSAGQKLEIAAPGLRMTVDATDVEEDNEGEVTIGVLGENDTYLDAYSSYSSDELPPRYDTPDFQSRTSALLVAQVSVPDDDWDDDDEDEDEDDEDYEEYDDGFDDDEDDDADAEAEYRDAEEEGDNEEDE